MSSRSMHYDVLIVGSGAGGLAAAVTAAHQGLKVLVAEKASQFGGTTAWSGGGMWVPVNPLAKEAGIIDSPELVKTYLRHEAGNYFDEARIDAFIENSPKMVNFFQNNTALTFRLAPTFADYHPDQPGGLSGGRTIFPEDYDARHFGKKLHLMMRLPTREMTLFGIKIGASTDLRHFYNAKRSIKSAYHVAKVIGAHFRDMLLHGRAMRLVNGSALTARLLRSADDAGVTLWESATVERLIFKEGTVRGAVLERGGEELTIETKLGVVLAAGGYPWDIDRRRKLYTHHPDGHEHFSLAPPTNTGDGLKLGESIGASVEDRFPNAAVWGPISRIPYRDGSIGTILHATDRVKPGVIAVTPDGKRFVNESNSYHDFGQAWQRTRKGDEPLHGFVIADDKAIRKYGLGYARPDPIPRGFLIRSGYLIRGGTVEELATKAGIDPQGLRATLDAYNVHAPNGDDPEFGKGTTAYNRYVGDAEHKPNPCVAPIETGPFWAVKIQPGDIGTLAGLRVDEYTRVLDKDGAPIPGLYAAGNDAAGMFGGNYVGGGATLGPAMVTGFIAGSHLAGLAREREGATSMAT